jgi:hypothetical protein
MKVFKGLDEDFKCRELQYVVGETKREEKARMCWEGLHFCEKPQDVLRYYPIKSSRFAIVEAEEVQPLGEGDEFESKRVAKELTPLREISTKELIQMGAQEWFYQMKTFDKLKPHMTPEKYNEDGNHSTVRVVRDEENPIIALGHSSVGLTTKDNATVLIGQYGIAVARYEGAAFSDRKGISKVGKGGAAKSGKGGIAVGEENSAVQTFDDGISKAGERSLIYVIFFGA